MIASFLVLACAGEPDEGKDDSGGGPTGDDTGESVLDADGDGFAGDDCDDGDAAVHPGAEERCDGVDQDCDGDVVAGSSCTEIIDPGVSTTWVVEQDVGIGGFGMVGDVTGDGADDFLWSFGATADQAVAPGGTRAEEGPVVLPDEAAVVLTWGSGAMYTTGREVASVGDVDGDGSGDLSVFTTAGEMGVSLYFGPFDPGEVRDMYLDADAFWPASPEASDSWASGVAGDLDLDQDGRSDLAVGSPGGAADVDVYFGGDWVGRCSIGDAGSGRPDPLGDIDGDGVRDLMIQSLTPYLVSGADVPASCGAATMDVAVAWTDDGVGSERSAEIWSSLDDFTGDGIEDFVTSWPNAVVGGSEPGAIYFFSGSDTRGAFAREDAFASWVGPVDESNLGAVLFTADFDGDDVLDVIAGVETEESSSILVIPGMEIVSGAGELPAARMTFGAGVSWPGPGLNFYMAPADFDADGFDDLWVYHYPEDAPARIGILRGFDVPWDDDAYW